MNWDSLLPVLLSVGVISASIAATANVIVAVLNNKRLMALEKNKHDIELIQYRYIKLYNILEEISQLEPLSYDISKEHYKNTVSNVTNRFNVFFKKYDLIEPLIQEHYLVKVKICLDKEKDLSNRVLEYVYASNSNFDLKELLMIRYELEKLLIVAIQNQLKSLLSQV